MTIRILYNEAVMEKEYNLLLLLDFLLFEKQTVKLEDDISTLDLYFKPNNQAKMNDLLSEYKSEATG